MRESDFLKRKPNFQQDFYAQTLVFLLYFLGAWILLFGTHLAGMWTDLFSPLDSLFYSYPTKLFSAHLPLWNDRISIGSPAFTDPEFQSFYPPALLIFNLLPAPLSYHLFLMIHYAAAGFFTYRFMRVQGLGGISCFWGGVVFEFCGFLTAHKLHINMICAGIYLPVVLLAIERMRQTNRFKYAAYTAIGFALSILAGYPQITLYMAFVSFAYGLWRSLDLPPAQRNVLIGFVHFAFILGVVLSAIQILPTIQLFKLATRESISYRYFSMYSFGLQNLPQLIFPFLYGGGYSNSGFNLALGAVGMIETAGYAGILPPLLAVLGLIVCWKSTPQVRFWSVLAVLSFLLVLGVSTPLYGLLYHVPMVNLFRGPARNWYECHFAIAVLSSFGLDSLLNEMDTNRRFAQKATMIFAATCLGAVLILILAVLTISKLPDSHSIFTWMNVTNVALARANLEMGSPAVLIPLILLTLSAGWLFLLSKKTLKFLPALGLVVFLYLDLFSFGHYLGREFLSFSEIQNPPASIRYLLSRPDLQDFRVYPTNRCAFVTLLYPDANMLYGLATVNGFEDVVLKDYAAATGFSFLGTNSRERQLLVENKLLSLLSVRYVITRDAELAGFLSSNRNSLDFPYVKVFQDNPTDLEAKLLLQNELRPQKIRKGEENTPFAIFENKSYLPRVRFVRTLIPVPDLSAATSILKRGTDFDWVNSAIVETKTELQHALAGGKILSSIYNSGFIQIHAKTEGNAFLILSDQYYPGWTALVDGKQTSIYRTNGLVRGVFVTAPGDHTIEFHFAPPFLLWGAVFSSLTLVFLFTSLILSSRTAKHEQAKPVGQKCGNPGHSGRALGAAGASHSLFRWLFLSHF